MYANMRMFCFCVFPSGDSLRCLYVCTPLSRSPHTRSHAGSPRQWHIGVPVRVLGVSRRTRPVWYQDAAEDSGGCPCAGLLLAALPLLAARQHLPALARVYLRPLHDLPVLRSGGW